MVSKCNSVRSHFYKKTIKLTNYSRSGFCSHNEIGTASLDQFNYRLCVNVSCISVAQNRASVSPKFKACIETIAQALKGPLPLATISDANLSSLLSSQI